MLIPVLVRKNYKITTSQAVTLESIVGSNLPLLFPELLLMNRTPTSCSVTAVGVRSFGFTNQTDPDFDGSVSQTFFPSLAFANGTNLTITGLGNQLIGTGYGISSVLTLTNAGPAAEARISLILRGMIESSVSPDPLAVING